LKLLYFKKKTRDILKIIGHGKKREEEQLVTSFKI
jgi:hypothetical protein